MRTLILLLSLTTIGCRTARLSVAPAPKPAAGSFVDLQPGWRLRVITPLLAGGGYQVKSSQTQQGNTITLETGRDFLGYETAYYAVAPGLKVRFATAELSREGKAVPQAKPLHPMFALRRGVKHVRLLYLERGSSTTHDMAVLSARTLPELDALTVQAQNSCCERGCEWVPAGIAVRPERHRDGQWIPAR